MGHADYYKHGDYNAICDKVKLTQETLKQVLKYYPDTGRLEWLLPSKGTKITDIVGNIAHRGKRVYREVCVLGCRTYAHKLAFLYMTGQWPSQDIDHIDGNGLNNSWNNLRCVPRQKNSQNAIRSSRNTSGVTGVFVRKNRYLANICVGYKTVYLGSFDNLFDAVCARKSAEIRYGFHINHGRR